MSFKCFFIGDRTLDELFIHDTSYMLHFVWLLQKEINYCCFTNLDSNQDAPEGHECLSMFPWKIHLQDTHCFPDHPDWSQGNKNSKGYFVLSQGILRGSICTDLSVKSIWRFLYPWIINLEIILNHPKHPHWSQVDCNDNGLFTFVPRILKI